MTSKRKRLKEPLSLDTASSSSSAQVAIQSSAATSETSDVEYRTARVLAACRLALFESPRACRTTLGKFRKLIDPDMARALKVIGGHKIKNGLHEYHKPLIYSLEKGDVSTAQSLIAAGAEVDAADFNSLTFKWHLSLVKNGKCRDLLEDHATVLTTLHADPTALVSAVVAHCSNFASSPATALSLRAYHFDPSFLWVTHTAYAAVVAWVRNAFVVQQATTIELFLELPDDCAGDVLEFLEVTLPRIESLHVATHCSSAEANAWVRAVVEAAVVTKTAADIETAADEGNLAALQEYLAKGIDVDTRTAHGNTALTLASYRGHTATVKYLLEAGADLEAKDYDGLTALIIASQNGHTATAKLLLEKGADKEATDECGRTALMEASYESHNAIVKHLLEAGVEKETKDRHDGSTAFMLASAFGDHGTMMLLLDSGADKEARNASGGTALMKASSAGNPENLEFLLQLGANINNKDDFGTTALMIASQNGEFDAAEFLLGVGANKDVQDKYGKTPLMWASQQGHVNIVQLLLGEGADKEVKDNDNKTALDLASEFNKAALANLLRQ